MVVSYGGGGRFRITWRVKPTKPKPSQQLTLCAAGQAVGGLATTNDRAYITRVQFGDGDGGGGDEPIVHTATNSRHYNPMRMNDGNQVPPAMIMDH